MHQPQPVPAERHSLMRLIFAGRSRLQKLTIFRCETWKQRQTWSSGFMAGLGERGEPGERVIWFILRLPMHTITITTFIAAPPERCFDLSRSIDAHIQSTSETNERAVGERTTGLLELGEEVTWEARHFGVTQRLTSKITAFDRPRYFQDRMQRGAFRSMEHDHYFEAHPGGTRMLDVVRFSAPLWALGWVAERLVLRRYLTTFLTTRANVLKQIAESERWREFVPQ